MGDPKGFLTTPRELPVRRPVDLRLRDWREVYEDFPRTDLEAQAGRCMNCGIPFCHQGCPLGNLIPEWNDLVYRHDWREATERLHATNNFPEFTGTLCPAPCEAACVLAINSDAVTIKQVEIEIIDRAWDEGWVPPQKAETRTGKKVAVVGSGPSGLAAAQQLTRVGHDVVVFERADRIGGLLRYGIPEFKMEKARLDRRLAQMRDEGTIFKASVDVGTDVTAEQLRAEFDAVVLAGGATAWRDLPAPGREAKGVYQAMEYLPWANHVQQGDIDAPPISAKDKHVVIIGGGDTGADCLGTSHRQGAASVTQLEIMPTPPEKRTEGMPWPTYPMVYRVSSAHEEGGERLYSVNTTEFVADERGRAGRHQDRRGRAGRRGPVRAGRGRRGEGAARAARAARHGLRRAGEGQAAVGPRGGARPARQRRARPELHDERRGRLLGGRHGPRAEPHRVGDRGGPVGGGRGGRLPDRPHRAPPPDQPDGPAAPLGTHDRDHRHTTPVGTGLMCHSTRSLPCEALHHRGERFVERPVDRDVARAERLAAALQLVDHGVDVAAEQRERIGRDEVAMSAPMKLFVHGGTSSPTTNRFIASSISSARARGRAQARDHGAELVAARERARGDRHDVGDLRGQRQRLGAGRRHEHRRALLAVELAQVGDGLLHLVAPLGRGAVGHAQLGGALRHAVVPGADAHVEPPLVSTERLCASHAACRGVRSGLASTNVPTRSGATVAATASEENGESNCTPSGMSTVE